MANGASPSDSGTVIGPRKTPSDLGTVIGPRKSPVPMAGVFDPAVGAYRDITSGLRRDPDVDYGPGLGFETEQAVKRADPADIPLVLENRYGTGAAKKDPAGNWYVDVAGKKTAVFGDQSPFARRAATSTLSIAPETAGMAAGAAGGATVGAAIGGPAAPITAPVGALVGAGLGGAGGRAASDFYNYLTGDFGGTAEREAQSLAQEGVWSATGEVGVRGLSMLGRVAMAPKKIPWVHVSPQIESLTDEMLARGLTPTVEQATGGETYRIFMMHQKLVQYMWGDPVIKKNIGNLNKQLVDKLTAAGVPPGQTDAALRAIIQRDIPKTQANEAITKAVEDYQNSLNTIAEGATTKAKSALDDQFKRLDQQIADPRIDLSTAVDNDITAARETFRNQSGLQAQLVDELAGGQPLVDTGSIKSAAQDVLDALPKTQGTPAQRVVVPPSQQMGWHVQTTPARPGTPLGVTAETPTMAYIRDMQKLAPRISVGDAQRIRSTLLTLTRDPGLTPGIGNRELNMIRDGVDTAIDGLATTDPAVLRALRNFNQFYKDGIVKFQDVLANRLVKEAGQSGSIEPEKVLNTIVRNGKVAQANRIMNLLTPQTRQQLGRDYFTDIIDRASDPADPGKLLGRRLLNTVSSERGMIEAVLGKDAFTKLRQLATNAADFDGKLPVDQLNPDTVGYFIKTMKAAQSARDAFMSENYLSVLANPKSPLRDEALAFVAKPTGNASRLSRVLALPGADTTIAPILRPTVMQDILSHSVAISKMRPGEQIFSGPELKNELQRYGREYLSTLFGKDTGEDLYRLGDVVNAISREYPSHMVGFVKGAGIMLAPFTTKHLPILIHGLIANQLMGTQTFIKWLIKGYEGDSTAMRIAAQISKNMVRAGEQAAIAPSIGSPVPTAAQRILQ